MLPILQLHALPSRRRAGAVTARTFGLAKLPFAFVLALALALALAFAFALALVLALALALALACW